MAGNRKRFFDHVNDDLLARVRFFGPNRSESGVQDIFSVIERAHIGKLFGGDAEIVAITSTEEHSYNDQSLIWFLPPEGKPRLLAEVAGPYLSLPLKAKADVPGLNIARQTYDGVNSEIKGTIEEFWTWNPDQRVLIEPKR